MNELFEGCPLAAEGAGARAPLSMGARLQSALVDFRRPTGMPARFVLHLGESNAEMLSPISKVLHEKGKAVLLSPDGVLSPGWDAKECFPDKYARAGALSRGITKPLEKAGQAPGQPWTTAQPSPPTQGTPQPQPQPPVPVPQATATRVPTGPQPAGAAAATVQHVHMAYNPGSAPATRPTAVEARAAGLDTPAPGVPADGTTAPGPEPGEAPPPPAPAAAAAATAAAAAAAAAAAKEEKAEKAAKAKREKAKKAKERERARVEKELKKACQNEDEALNKNMADYLAGKTLKMPGSACKEEAAPACGYWAVAAICSVDKSANTWLHVVGQPKSNKFYYPTSMVFGWAIDEK